MGKRAIKYHWICLIKEIFVKRFLKWNVIFTYSSWCQWFPLLNFRRQNVLYLNARLVLRHVVSRIGLVTCTHSVLVWVKQGFTPASKFFWGWKMYCLILPSKRLLGFPATINFMPFVNCLIFFQNYARILDRWIAVQILKFRMFMRSFCLQFYFVFLALIRQPSGKEVFNSMYFSNISGFSFYVEGLFTSSLLIELENWAYVLKNGKSG